MDLIDKLRELAIKVPKLKQDGVIKTEEGTKNALVMPFIMALGYDVFNPSEVTPELVADVGTKKGEKVDYAILRDGKPIMLFECKSFGTDLKHVHASQLYRYFSTTSTRFGVLTDGVVYRFYSDLDEPNKMDQAPFFIFDLADFDLADFKENQLEELKRFSKSTYDEVNLINSAREIKYKNALSDFLMSLFDKPSEAFVRFCIQESKAYTGRVTQSVIEEFTPLTLNAYISVINNQVNRRLKSALAPEPVIPAPQETPPQEPEAVTSAATIVTTQEEIDAYFAVKSIVREVIEVKRVFMRDAQSYCSIIIDNNNRKTICRLLFNGAKKSIVIINDQKVEEKFPIESIDDIYTLSEKLKATAARFL